MTIILDVVIFGHDNSTVRLAKNKSVSIVMIHISMSLHTHSQTNSEGCFIFFLHFSRKQYNCPAGREVLKVEGPPNLR